MGGISVGGGGGGKKSVDSEIPLVPFIDLLLCCVMFLLVTAVWNKLASMEAAAPQMPSPMGEEDGDPRGGDLLPDGAQRGLRGRLLGRRSAPGAAERQAASTTASR